MNGVHDMGGMHGLGPVERERDEPVFHHEWERRVLAVTVACGALGRWNLDMSRHARELMPGAEYLATSYYEHWLWGLEHLLARHGLVTPEEIEARVAAGGRAPTRAAPGPGTADAVQALTRATGKARVGADADHPPRFRPGDPVRARNVHPTGHTRLPRFARGRDGEVVADHGVWIFPDASAAGRGPAPERLYAVRFAARELWGEGAPARDAVFLDLFDSYLDPIGPGDPTTRSTARSTTSSTTRPAP